MHCEDNVFSSSFFVTVPPMSHDQYRSLASVTATAVASLAMQQQKRRARTSCEWHVVLGMLLSDEPMFLDEEPPAKRAREVHARPDYAQSAWARMLRAEGVKVPGSRESNLFRRDFRLPYAVFVELVAMVKDLRWFPFTDGDLEPEEELKDVAGR